MDSKESVHVKSKKAKREKRKKSLEETSTLIIDVNPCHRYTLLTINLFLMLFTGVATGGSVISLIMRWNDVRLISDPILLNLVVNLEFPYLIMGVLGLLAATVGFMGTLRQNVTLLKVYDEIIFVFMMIVLILGLLFVAIPYISRGSIKNLVSTKLVIYYRDNEDFQGFIDYVQTNFQCCGVTNNNFRDWNLNVYFNCSKANPSPERCSVPPSCCRSQDSNNPADVLSRRFCGRGILAMTDNQAWNTVHVRNCVDAIIGAIKRNSIFLSAVVVATLLMLLTLSSMVTTLMNELETLTQAYQKYYTAVAKGLKKKLAKVTAMEQVRGNDLVDLARSDYEVDTAGSVRRGRAHVQACRTPGTEFDRAISYAVLPQLGRFHGERATLLASWDCPRHNVRKYSHVYDPNCAACRRMEQQHTPGTPHTPHRGHHVEHDPS